MILSLLSINDLHSCLIRPWVFNTNSNQYNLVFILIFHTNLSPKLLLLFLDNIHIPFNTTQFHFAFTHKPFSQCVCLFFFSNERKTTNERKHVTVHVFYKHLVDYHVINKNKITHTQEDTLSTLYALWCATSTLGLRREFLDDTVKETLVRRKSDGSLSPTYTVPVLWSLRKKETDRTPRGLSEQLGRNMWTVIRRWVVRKRTMK